MTGNEMQLTELRCLLKKIYKDQPAEKFDCMWSQLLHILELNSINCSYKSDNKTNPKWDSSTAILITYADGVYSKNKPSLRLLKELIDNHIGNLAGIIHLLPFLSSTSDGGFAVSSFDEINPNFGSWDDLKSISENHILMADLVVNHVSASHPWVQQFKNLSKPGKEYILSPKEKNKWDNVVRPRNSSLFTRIATKEGNKDVWTTFGPDQIDVNWREPYLLIEFLVLIKRYINHGIKWIRLDAIGFIWKEPDTTCLHMEEVHNLVKVLRIILKNLVNAGVLITETNVPETENISYLKPGNEAHLAYNFTLPPLLLESLINNKADLLNQWLCSWPELPKDTGFLNFTASHDGIGLRALEGIMDSKRLHDLLIACENRGGLISHRRMANGEDKPYELNISWWSSMSDIGENTNNWQFKRFVLSQLFIMCLKGVPAFYLQSLMASENNIKSFELTGERRDLNREKFDLDDLNILLEDQNSLASKNLRYLNKAMSVRSQFQAFHPDASMKCLSKDKTELVIICRGKDEKRVWAIHNMTNNNISFCISEALAIELKPSFLWIDILSGSKFLGNEFNLEPYSVHWLFQKYERND